MTKFAASPVIKVLTVFENYIHSFVYVSSVRLETSPGTLRIRQLSSATPGNVESGIEDVLDVELAGNEAL